MRFPRQSIKVPQQKHASAAGVFLCLFALGLFENTDASTCVKGISDDPELQEPMRYRLAGMLIRAAQKATIAMEHGDLTWVDVLARNSGLDIEEVPPALQALKARPLTGSYSAPSRKF